MEVGQVFYKFAVHKNKPILKTFTLKGLSHDHTNSWKYEENYTIVGNLAFLHARDLNHVYFENEIGAATNIYEQYKLRTQQGVKSQMINKIVEWDYFQQLLEDYPAIMV